MSGGPWAVAWRGATEVDAELTAGLLRAAGIEALVEGSQTPYRAMTFPLGGTWLVRVRAEQLAAAQAVLEDAGEGANLERGEPEEGGLLTRDQRATLKAAGLGLAVLAIAVLALLLREAAG